MAGGGGVPKPHHDIAYAIPFTMEEKDALSLGSPSLEPQGDLDIVEPTPDIIPASSTAYISQSPIPVKPNVPYLGDVVLLQDGATATFHLAPLANPHVAPADESAEGCPNRHAHRSWHVCICVCRPRGNAHSRSPLGDNVLGPDGHVQCSAVQPGRAAERPREDRQGHEGSYVCLLRKGIPLAR